MFLEGEGVVYSKLVYRVGGKNPARHIIKVDTMIHFKSVSFVRQKISVAGFPWQNAVANAARYSRPMCLQENFMSCQTNGLKVYQPLIV